jgi:hypothetical protein
MDSVSLKIPKPLKAKAAKLAKAEGRSLGGLIRKLLTDEVARNASK